MHSDDGDFFLDDDDLFPEVKLFNDFLETHGDHNKTIRSLAIACLGLASRRKLPANDGLKDFLASIIENMATDESETSEKFRFFSGLTEHGPQPTAGEIEKNKADGQAIREALSNGQGLSESDRTRLFENIAQFTIHGARKKAEGFNDEARQEFAELISKHYLVNIAKICGDAVSFAMLNPTVGTFSDPDAPVLSNRERYSHLTHIMLQNVTFAVKDQIGELSQQLTQKAPGTRLKGPEIK